MEEIWVEVPDFPDYMVSNLGSFRKEFSHRTLTFSPIQRGDLTVGMMRDGVQYRRLARVLVARAFVEGENERFDTVIQLDGDKNNLRADNLMWRPRWFAHMWYKQMNREWPKWFHQGPIVDRAGNMYESYIDCSMKTGTLCTGQGGIRLSVYNNERAFPGGEVFSLVKDGEILRFGAEW